MKNQKGFTLIELLAVIVILAIIALVAVPIVLNMIENAKKSAAKASALGFIEAIEYGNGMVESDSSLGEQGYTWIADGTYTNAENEINPKVKNKGEKPSLIKTLVIENLKVKNAEMCIGG